jgi:hypothetical protein
VEVATFWYIVIAHWKNFTAGWTMLPAGALAKLFSRERPARSAAFGIHALFLMLYRDTNRLDPNRYTHKGDLTCGYVLRLRSFNSTWSDIPNSDRNRRTRGRECGLTP